MSAKSNNVSTKNLLFTDTTGLPLDLWRSVLSYLQIVDLCHCAQVCRSWAYLVKSLDITAWKRFYLESTHWKHPNWPRSQYGDVCKPWKTLYREHILATRWWSLYHSQPANTACFAPLRRKRDRRVINVGPKKPHTTLRSALNVATEYDRIVVHSGLYDEQFEMSSKIPFELVGEGKPGSVILIMSIEQNAATGRLCNLVLRAPWFTEHVLKVSTGHLQVDNCHLEDGQVIVQHPATVHFRYCSFNKVNTQFNHVNMSAVENCEFKQSTVCVEGYPKESLNWSHSYLLKWAQNLTGAEEEGYDDGYYQLYDAKILEDGSTVTTSDLYGASSTFEVNKSEVDSIGVASIDCQSYISNQDRETDYSSESDTLITSDSSSFKSDDEDHQDQCDPGMILSDRLGQLIVVEPTSRQKSMVRSTTRNDILVTVDQEIVSGNLYCVVENVNESATFFESDNEITNSNQCENTVKNLHLSEQKSIDQTEKDGQHVTSRENTNISNEYSIVNKDNQPCIVVSNEHSTVANSNEFASKHLDANKPQSSSKNFESNTATPSHQSQSVSLNLNLLEHNQPCSSSSSTRKVEDTSAAHSSPSSVQQLPSISISSRSKLTSENLPLPEVLEQWSDDSDDTSSTDSSPEVSALIKGKQGRMSPLWSSDSESLLEMKFETSFRDVLKQDSDIVNMIYNTQGPTLRHCLIHSGLGGIKVSQQGQCRVEQSEFRDLQYGIRCLQNAKVAIIQNDIHHCQTSGIFMRLAAHGVILGNDIYCTNEAGIDVRRNADPLIQCNRIHHCKRSGVAVLGSGCGMIKGNDIYHNREAGVYVLYKGNPYIVGNRIYRGGAAGIAVNENGHGYILDNYINNNRWGGIDIRNGGEPTVCRNLICNGLADGIVVGHKGRGVIEGNTVKGNDGCGIWIMGGQPLIQMNQIYNNNDTGVSFATERDAGQHDRDSDSLSETSDVEVSFSEESLSHKNNPPLPQLKFNTIFHNNGYGILCCNNEPLTLHGNAVHDNKNVGIYIKQDEPVEVTSNSVTSNLGAGIHVSSQSKVTVEGNGIYENRDHGLFIEGEAAVLHNDIFCNDLNAVVMSQEASVKVQDNRIHSPSDTAVKVTEAVQGHFSNNQIYQGHGKIFDLGKKSLVHISQNDIVEKMSDHSGIHVEDWHLESPAPRPHIEAPPPVVPQAPNKRISMVTRVVVPSAVPCQQSSRLCVIL